MIKGGRYLSPRFAIPLDDYSKPAPEMPGSPPPPPQGPHHTVLHHDRDGSALLSTTIAHAIASLARLDVSDAEELLYESVDLESLNRVFMHRDDGETRPAGTVEFRVDAYEITVDATGRIEITRSNT